MARLHARRPGPSPLPLLAAPAAPPRRPPAAEAGRSCTAMTARFAPGAHRRRPRGAARERAAGAGEAGRGGAAHGRALPAPGLGGQRDAAPGPARGRLAAGPRAPALLPHQQGALVAPRRGRAVPARASARSRRPANFYPAGATKEEVEAWMKALPEAERAEATRLLHHHPPRPRTAASTPCPTAWSTRASWRGPRRCCARRPPSPRSPRSRPFLEKRADAFLSQRLLRERRGLDGAGRVASSPPSAPTRSTRTSGSASRPPSRPSSPCATTRRPRSWPASAGELQDLEDHLPIDPALRNPKLGALAPIRVVNVVFTAGRRQPRRADRRLQPAQRRARGEGEGHQARDAKNVQEAKFEKVLLPIADGGAARGRPRRTSPSTRSSPTSSCTS